MKNVTFNFPNLKVHCLFKNFLCCFFTVSKHHFFLLFRLGKHVSKRKFLWNDIVCLNDSGVGKKNGRRMRDGKQNNMFVKKEVGVEFSSRSGSIVFTDVTFWSDNQHNNFSYDDTKLHIIGYLEHETVTVSTCGPLLARGIPYRITQ